MRGNTTNAAWHERVWKQILYQVHFVYSIEEVVVSLLSLSAQEGELL